MDIFEELGLHRYINAQDTFTKYGASCMLPSALRAMSEISEYCVDLYEVQEKAGDAIARLTNNEAAYITNGAAGALQECAASVLAVDSEEVFHQLPLTGERREILMQRAQHNMYDRSMAAAGAEIVYVGDEMRAPSEQEFENAITAHTAAIAYVIYFGREYALPIEKVIEIAHKHSLPVIVDAAAQNPPASNLWRFTHMGADMVIFSGGKTMRGPQDSGLVLGKREWINRLRKWGPPTDGVCRGCKTSREAMVGLYAAVKEYMAVDESARLACLNQYCDMFEKTMRECGFTEVWRVQEGPVGQQFPRSYAKMPYGSGRRLCEIMRNHGVYAGPYESDDMMLNPLMLTDEQVITVCRTLKQSMEEYKKELSQNGCH